MNTTAIAAIIVASLAVVTAGSGMIALAYRTGRLVGKVETLITQGTDNFTRLEKGLAQVITDLKQHLAWHFESRSRR